MDGSDENIAYCNVRVCPENYRQCNNRRCIPANQTCMDGSDVSTGCGDDLFSCSTGQCIDSKLRCDKGMRMLTINNIFFYNIIIRSTQTQTVQMLQMR